VARYFPHYPGVYARLEWTMFQSIDRVHDASKAARRLGFVCAVGFREVLEQLQSTPERAGKSSRP
jgi:UDP-glucose 4-epimerase